MYLSVLLQFPLTALLLLLLLLSNCLKGYTKGMCLYKVIPLHTIFTVTKIQLQKQNNIHNTSIELTNHIKINCFNLDLKCLTWLRAKISSGIVFHKNATDTKKQ